MNTGGQPLDAHTRSFFEPRLGYDLSNVRVHTDSRAGESARAVAAKAYTLGNNIVFGRGQYSPNSEAGKKLIAHELAHVTQTGSSSNIRRDTIYRQPDDERELFLTEQEIIQLKSALETVQRPHRRSRNSRERSWRKAKGGHRLV
jgi:hypothetical protein